VRGQGGNGLVSTLLGLLLALSCAARLCEELMYPNRLIVADYFKAQPLELRVGKALGGRGGGLKW
jgi:hypothetical protein